uniref:phospholipase A1 n=1 Tax=Trichogramma kaykai TaxID=54128 RepID=A0ABD2WZP2_9HYME
MLLIVRNASSNPQVNSFANIQEMISEEDMKLFNSIEGVWFADDRGHAVEATLDISIGPMRIFEDIQSEVLFYTYEKELKVYKQFFYGDLESLKNSTFDPKKETKIITHGWFNSMNSESCLLIRDAYVTSGDYNIIVIDWSSISMRLYTSAAFQVVSVGNYVSKVLEFLEVQGMNLNTTTLIGHSLGAHVMGIAGYYTKNTVNYIVGLDPALPLFHFAKTGSRLSKTDANIVEVIHTNGGLLGYLSAIGTIDFYPNGGSIQPGCYFDFGGICSHLRSYEFFAESITSKVGFYGVKCNNYLSFRLGLCKGEQILMGGNNSPTISGIFYLITKSSSPYAAGLE